MQVGIYGPLTLSTPFCRDKSDLIELTVSLGCLWEFMEFMVLLITVVDALFY